MATREQVLPALDRFGREVVVGVRDSAISEYDNGIRRAPKAKPRPDAAMAVQQRDADAKIIAGLPDELRDLIRRQVVDVVDNAIHHLLWRLSQEADFDQASLVFDGIELFTAATETMAWEGLFWGPYAEDGWYARFSEFREHGT